MKEAAAAAAAISKSTQNPANPGDRPRQSYTPPLQRACVHRWGAQCHRARCRAVGMAVRDNPSARRPRAPPPPIDGPTRVSVGGGPSIDAYRAAAYFSTQFATTTLLFTLLCNNPLRYASAACVLRGTGAGAASWLLAVRYEPLRRSLGAAHVDPMRRPHRPRSQTADVAATSAPEKAELQRGRVPPAHSEEATKQ
ncbi:hypothetical protein T492DRAFT_911454 [Pavlovales sp. CCMP2436]|nr:hypothetical protein T492DRAFT_911454 [Pavlovales sp. CCMP2436]